MPETRRFVLDTTVDRMRISPAPRDSHSSVVADVAMELRPIKTFLESISWSHIDTCAHCVLFQIGFGNDLADFDFGDELEPDDQPFEGVRFSEAFSDPPCEVIVSRAAFERLMLRYFDVMSEVVPQRNPDVVLDPRWENYLRDVESLRSRIQTEAP